MNSLHDLFLLMFSISQMRDEKRIVQFFCESFSELFKPVIFNFSEENISNQIFIEEIKTHNSSYGFLYSNDKVAENIYPLLQNAIQMLAIFLERLNYENQLHKDKKSIEKIADSRLIELEIKLKELDLAKIASLNLVEDLSEEIELKDAAKKTLAESEEKFKAISEQTIDGISLADLSGNFVFVNSAFCKMVGYSEHELLKMNISNFKSPSEVPMYFANLKKKGANIYNDVELLCKDKSSIYVELSGKIINIGNKKLALGVMRDNAERDKAEQEIHKLSNAIEQTPVSIVITNIDGNIEYVNPKFTEVTGYTLEEAYNQNPKVLKSGEQPTEFYKNLWKTISSGNIWAGEFHNKKKNGELFWESAIISPIKDDEGKITHYVAVKEDITEKKAMIEELISSKEKAENADKLKSIFLAQMSHEIRTPINALVSMASLLRYDFEDGADEDQLMSFDVIDRAGGRIIRTVDLLINLSEIQAGTYDVAPTQFDIVSDVLSIVIAEYKNIAKKKKINLKLESNMVDTELVADSYTVNQIFTQLIDNAIKYTEEGEVIIKTLRNESDQLVVEIKDTGIGIHEEYLPDLFKPFSQEEMGYTRKFDGNGIGMALVSKYCELNNAKIEVESTKGVGSIFRVFFN